MPSSSYILFIDETGTHGFYPAATGNNRFLCLIGCIVPKSTYGNVFVPRLNEIKGDYFGHWPEQPVVLHRFDVDQRTGPFKCLKDRDLRKDFNKAMVTFYKEQSYWVVTVAINKLSHHAKYGSKAWHPYHYCAEVLLERFCLFLNRVDGLGITCAESRQEHDNALLANEWRRFYLRGTRYVSAQTMAKRLIDGELRFKEKVDNIAGLQIADMLAQAALEKMLVEKGHKDQIKDNVTKFVCGALDQKWDRKPGTGATWGYGKVLLE